MKKYNKRIGLSISLAFLLNMVSPVISASAATGDFYNLTKKITYQRNDLISDEALTVKLEAEMDDGDVIAKEMSGGKVINYTKASMKFLELLKTMSPQLALTTAVSSIEIKIDKVALGLDKFQDSKTPVSDKLEVTDIS